MSKVDIDYSNTIIYKITCNDPKVNDVYVGHTTNFVQRKHAHKQSCINEKSPNNKCKLYEVIRANGGWLNWNMEIIHFCNCKNQYDARIKEQEYFVLLKANLNSIEPMSPKKPILVKSSLSHSVNTSKVHPITRCALESSQFELTYDISKNNTNKNIKNHRCEKCRFKCSKLGDWNRHIITSKHINGNNLATVNTSNIQQYICDECCKIYNDRSGLWRHKKKCAHQKENGDDELSNNINLILEMLKEKPLLTENNDSLIIELLKQNQDFKHLMIEQNKYMMEQSKQMMDIAKHAGTQH
jgi:hypothetical protein